MDQFRSGLLTFGKPKKHWKHRMICPRGECFSVLLVEKKNKLVFLAAVELQITAPGIRNANPVGAVIELKR